MHFHMHDGHPLSSYSLFGVSDHLSFLQRIPLPFAYQGTRVLTGIFGIEGMRQLVRAVTDALPPDRLSFMLEIHPQEGRAPLREHAHLFNHWRDKSGAERMNYWLDRLLDNAALLRDATGASDKSGAEQVADVASHFRTTP
jgi:hypothetical protein